MQRQDETTFGDAPPDHVNDDQTTSPDPPSPPPVVSPNNTTTTSTAGGQTAPAQPPTRDCDLTQEDCRRREALSRVPGATTEVRADGTAFR